MATTCELWAVGRLTRDAEVRFTQGGKRLLTFSLATEGDGPDDSTVWLNCTLWETDYQDRPQHDIPHWQQALEQGAYVYVKGRPRARAYMGKDGQPKGSLELTVTKLELPSARAPTGEPSAPADSLEEVPF